MARADFLEVIEESFNLHKDGVFRSFERRVNYEEDTTNPGDERLTLPAFSRLPEVVLELNREYIDAVAAYHNKGETYPQLPQGEATRLASLGVSGADSGYNLALDANIQGILQWTGFQHDGDSPVHSSFLIERVEPIQEATEEIRHFNLYARTQAMNKVDQQR